jgi:molecular chaperone DnaK
MKAPIAGIDLGTTNSSIAAFIDGAIRVIDIQGASSIPSCVGLDSTGRLIVGTPARNQASAASEATLLSVKRHMGEDIRLPLGTKDYSPEEISALILGELKQGAEASLGCTLTEAVITVPAFFNERQRHATRTAGELAGFDVKRILNEPTAAALAYGAEQTPDENLLVYDLGGGTFDVSVVVSQGGIVEVKSSHGDTHLGGDDFDALLVEHVLEFFQTRHGIDLSEDPAAARRLKFALEAAKCRLSDEPFTQVREEYLSGDLHLDLEIERQLYENLIESHISKTITCVGQALNDAGLSASDIGKIMMVGGSTRTPLVQQQLRERLRLEPRWEINPDLIVAMGAAVQGANLSGHKTDSILVDITPHTFSTATIQDNGGFAPPSLTCVPLIPRNSPLPVTKSELFYTMFPGQDAVEITAYQGEHSDPELNSLVGKFMCEGLDPNAPGNSPILISFGLDLSGMLKVTATEKTTGLTKTVALDTHNLAAPVDLDVSRQRISDLLINPDEKQEEDDDDAEDFSNDDDGSFIEPLTPQQSDTAADQEELLKSAKQLRHRAESLLDKDISAEDASEIRSQLDKARHTIANREWAALQTVLDSLSDLLFYLED